MFADRLTKKIKETGNPVVAGLDPRLSYLPESILREAIRKYDRTFKAAGYALRTFNREVIDVLQGIVPAIKPQFACYESYGPQGMEALADTVAYAKAKGFLVIGDGKRNDIGSTAKAYADAYLGTTDLFGEPVVNMDFDALTVNPYLGIDGIQPFIDCCKAYGKGIFVLVKTSNESSGELQDLVTKEGPVYEKVAELVKRWGIGTIGENGFGSVGAVVGATYPDQAAKARLLMPESYILVPGYGTQGGTAKDCMPSFRKDGTGAIINASRSLVFAYKTKRWENRYDGGNYRDIIIEEALRMKREISEAFEEREKTVL